MSDKDTLLSGLIKLVYRHQALLNAVALNLSDQACLLSTTLKTCKCQQEPVTVSFVLNPETELCDRCVAELIVTAKKLICDPSIASATSNIHPLMMDENSWVDLPNAEIVRRLTSYVKLVHSLENPSVQVH